MKSAIPLAGVLLALLCVCECFPGQIVIAPDGAERIVDWENAPIATDSLNLYNSAWGDSTPDNPWARSVVVRGDRVVRVVPRGAAEIPADGFVLTGHAASAGWLNDHLPEGAQVRITPTPPFAEEFAERDVDAVDPAGTDFPSGRGADQLVVYTPAFGERTGTNIFGAECIVRAGRIVERTGGDSLIPGDGLVISGHGRGSAWIMRNCPVGARMELTGKHLTIARDREAYFLEAEGDVRQARKRIDWADGAGIDCPLDQARAALGEAERCLSGARSLSEDDEMEAASALVLARRAAWTACARASETRSSEARGAWLWYGRNLVTSEQRREYFSRLQSANLNMILPLIDSILGLPDGEQLLRDVITEAHEAGMEVHPWTWLPVHSVPSAKDADRLAEHPEWADVGRDGKPLKTLDLANAEARAEIVRDAVWLATSFPIDGLHMDWEGMYGGFSEISRREFAAEHGYDPVGDEGPTGPERIRDLYLWQVALVDRVVSEVTSALREAGSQIPVSSAVQCFNLHPNIPADTGASYQWMRWVARGQIDIACPMIYAQNVDFVSRAAMQMQEEIAGRALHYAGLICYPETAQTGLVDPHQLLEQIDAARAAGCEGILLFPAEHLFRKPWAPDDRLLLALKEGPFRQKATRPHNGRVRSALAPEAQVPYLYATVTPVADSVRCEEDGTALAPMRVENWGTEAFEVLGAEARSPAGWEASLAREGPSRVEPGGNLELGLTLRAPDEAAGEARVNIRLRVAVDSVEQMLQAPLVRVVR